MSVDSSVESDGPPQGETGAETQAPDAMDGEMAADVVVPHEAGDGGCAAGVVVIVLSDAGMSGPFGTTGAACIEFMSSVNGWSAFNVGGRSIVVTGNTTQSPDAGNGQSLVNQPGMSPGADGYIYWNFTGGAQAMSFANMSVY